MTIDDEVQQMLADRRASLERTYREYMSVTKDVRGNYSSPAITAEDVYEKIVLKRTRGIKAIPTGVDWWDTFAGPLRRGNTYLICGYAGSGKTTLSLNLAWSMAQAGRKVWYYCLELSSEETFEVLAGRVLGKAVLSESDETLAYAQIQGTGFRFYEPAGYQPWEKRIEEIINTVRAQEIEVVFIDNFGFMTRSMSHQFEAESVASAKLKSMAQELEIPVVILHHLRKPESDSMEPEPTAHTAKGSGALANDASDLFILHHPLTDEGETLREPVGYLLSGKPRWGKGGKMYVRLEGSRRTYSASVSSEYRGKRRRVRKHVD